MADSAHMESTEPLKGPLRYKVAAPNVLAITKFLETKGMTKKEEFSVLDDGLDDEQKPDPMNDPLNVVLEGVTTEEEDEKEEEEEDVAQTKARDNREARRAKDALRKEREDNARMAGRLEAMAEAARAASASETADYLKQVERIYGTETPEAAEATRLLQEAMKGLEERAVDRAYDRFSEDRKREAREVQEARERLGDMVGDIEDEYNITMSPSLQSSFFSLLQKMSPKDEQGNIKEYADHHAVWESLQTRITSKKDSKAKDIAARSMTTSASASGDAAGKTDPNWNYLSKELGW